jgi:NitT/TauT family transport system ATP-binding protein
VTERLTAIDVAAADKVFATGVRALGPITLEVDEGEFVSVIGPSGCGKSTLLKIVAGLLAPSRGGVRLWPDAAASKEVRERRTAFVFQSATLMAWANVEKNVRLPLDLGHADATNAVHAADRVERALTLVGLQDFRRAYPRELSGGMQMRASIARALVTEPSLLLMDEPFGALDEITRARLDRELSGLWAREALTILFVTHSIYEAVFLSTRVFVMSPRPGRIVGEVAIDEPRPRTDAFRVSAAFAAHCARLSAMLASAMESAVEGAAS